MNEQTLKETIAELTLVAVYKGEMDDESEVFEAEGALWVRRPPNPPATTEAIERCEQFLGRKFSPSYRHFLGLHDGWPHFQKNDNLLGTQDYTSPAFQTKFSQLIRDNLNTVADFDLSELDETLFYPQNWYRFVDSKARNLGKNLPAILYDVKKIIDAYREDHKCFGDILMCKHTMIGLSENNSNCVVLDTGTLRRNGEMKVVNYRFGASDWLEGEFSANAWLMVNDFYEWLEDALDTAWRGE